MEFRTRILALIHSLRAQLPETASVRELADTFYKFIEEAVVSAMDLENTGTEKKALVMDAISQFYDVVAPSIPLPMLLQPIRPFVRPHIKKVVMIAADAAVEWVYAKLKQRVTA